MTDQGSGETPTTNVPTPPTQPPAAPAYAPPPAAYPQPPAAYPPPQPPAWGQTQQPPQQGWGQPQPPAGPAWGQPQQPGPAWGQPQPPAQGWVQPQQQPQYWGNPNAQLSGNHGNSIVAIIAGVPLLVYGLLITLGGAALLVIRSFVDDVIRQGGFDTALAQSVRDAIAVVAVIILICGILHVLAAIGIWAHKGWGRWLGIIWGVLGTLFGLAALGGVRSTTTSSTAGSGIGGALFILVPYAFVLIAMIIGGGHFRRTRG